MKLQQIGFRLLKSRIHLLSVLSKKQAADYAFTIFCTPLTKGTYEPTAILKEAAPLQHRFGNIILHGYQWNTGAPKKIFIAHGFRSHAQRFEHFIPLLIKKNYEITAFDAPAHGRSQGKQTNAIEYAGVLQALNDRYGPFNAYLAHSFGGLAVCMAVADIPANKDIKIILLAPASNTQTLINQFFDQMDIKNETVKKYFYGRIKNLSNHDLPWFTIERCMQTITGPVLWIHDEQDNIIPADDARYLAQKNYPNVHFLFTNGLGHSKIYRDEKMVTQIINFL